MTAESVQPARSGILRLPLVAGAFLALVAVMAGAFGAHGLRNLVSERGLEVFQTAVTYQMYHSIALVLLALLAAQGLSATVADARFAKPLDKDLVRQLADEHEVLITIEEGAVGGFGAFVFSKTTISPKMFLENPILLKIPFVGENLASTTQSPPFERKSHFRFSPDFGSVIFLQTSSFFILQTFCAKRTSHFPQHKHLIFSTHFVFQKRVVVIYFPKW